MTSALDVAAYVLGQHGPMTALKLQKLVYYTQAWSLGLRQRALFDEEIQAWAYGPVIYELYQCHRRKLNVDGLSRGDASRLSQHDRDFINRVVDHYGAMNGYELSKQTHAEPPWQKAREGVAPIEAGREAMLQRDIQAYFEKQKPPFDWP